MNEMKENNKVYFVTITQAIEWMKNPTKLDKIKDFRPWRC